MEVETTAETPETQTPPPAEGAGEVTPPAAPGGDGGTGEPPAAAVVVPPAYQPNLTFRMRDVSNRQVERKFDDWTHTVVKDAETEKKVRELHERAYGLDAVKSDRERLSNENTGLKQRVQEWEPTINAVQQIAHHRDQKNFPAVFQLLGVDPKEVFTWAYQYASMSPEARMQAEAAARGSMEAYGAQHQMTQAQRQAVQQAQEFKSRELGFILQYDQEVSGAQAAFDQMHGPGAFIEQVRRTGEYYWHQGRDVPVQDAVRDVMKLIGRAAPAQPGQSPQAPQAAAPQVVPPSQKPVIPSVAGTGSSPVKRVYRSMEDIKKRRQELEAAGE